MKPTYGAREILKLTMEPEEGGTARPAVVEAVSHTSDTGRAMATGRVRTLNDLMEEVLKAEAAAHFEEDERQKAKWVGRYRVVEWKVNRVCLHCGKAFSLTVPADSYGRPSRKGNGTQTYCERECMTSALKVRKAEDEAAGRVARGRFEGDQDQGQTLAYLVGVAIDTQESLGALARNVGLMLDGKADASTVAALGDRLATVEALLANTQTRLTEVEDQLSTTVREVQELRQAQSATFA